MVCLPVCSGCVSFVFLFYFDFVLYLTVTLHVHRFSEKEDTRIVCITFNKSGYIFVIFGMHHQDNSGNRKNAKYFITGLTRH